VAGWRTKVGKRGLTLLDATGLVDFAEHLVVARLVALGKNVDHAGLADASRLARERPTVRMRASAVTSACV